MPKDAMEVNSNNSVVPSVDEDLDEDGCCRCCHCGSGQEEVKNQSYLKMREHLQQRLKAKNNLCNSACDSPSGSRSSSSNCNIDGYAELDYLVQYIEGHNTPQRVGQPNPKRAAKKARQKEKKLEQKRMEELAAKQQETMKAQSSLASNKANQDRVPNGMVRITHNPLTNSAVITPLYGPLEHNPSYLQQPLGLSPPQSSSLNHATADSSKPNNIITAPKLGSSSVSSQQNSESTSTPSTASSSQPQQMVTIRRVMQPNLSEPVVTVTLKGETPDNDKVLFTLVNGQVLPTEKLNSASSISTTGRSTQPSQTSSTIANGAVETTNSATAAQLKKKQKKQEKKKQKKLLATMNSAEDFQNPSQLDQIQGNRISTRLEHFHQHSQQDMFSLDNFRLPPGITLTRVQGSHPPAHPELPMRMVDRSQRQDSHSLTSNSSNGSSPIIVTSPLTAPKPKESLGSLGGLAAPNVIVVDTRKIQQHQPGIPQQQPKTVQTCSVGVQTGEDGEDDLSLLNATGLTKQQRKKLRRREKLLEEQAVLNQLAALQLNSNSTSKKSNESGKKTASASTNVTTKGTSNQLKSTSSQGTVRGKQPNVPQTKDVANGSAGVSGGKAGSKKKKKSRTSNCQASEDKWEENVFVPKSDIDLEGGDLDDDERELEAFKRFCFNTVPPERKEKVRIHLNVKDIFGKKSNGLHMTSCK